MIQFLLQNLKYYYTTFFFNGDPGQQMVVQLTWKEWSLLLKGFWGKKLQLLNYCF